MVISAPQILQFYPQRKQNIITSFFYYLNMIWYGRESNPHFSFSVYMDVHAMKNRGPLCIPVLASTWFETGSLVATKYGRPAAHELLLGSLLSRPPIFHRSTRMELPRLACTCHLEMWTPSSCVCIASASPTEPSPQWVILSRLQGLAEGFFQKVSLTASSF